MKPNLVTEDSNRLPLGFWNVSLDPFDKTELEHKNRAHSREMMR